MINAYIKKYRERDFTPRIVCADGFSISVQGSKSHYCTPQAICSKYTHVECGFPSLAPEFIGKYAEDKEDLTDTVYPYVPIKLVEHLVELHGGIVCESI